MGDYIAEQAGCAAPLGRILPFGRSRSSQDVRRNSSAAASPRSPYAPLGKPLSPLGRMQRFFSFKSSSSRDLGISRGSSNAAERLGSLTYSSSHWDSLRVLVPLGLLGK
eukprot:2347092-Rhodomonas_salina.2